MSVTLWRGWKITKPEWLDNVCGCMGTLLLIHPFAVNIAHRRRIDGLTQITTSIEILDTKGTMKWRCISYRLKS